LKRIFWDGRARWGFTLTPSADVRAAPLTVFAGLPCSVRFTVNGCVPLPTNGAGNSGTISTPSALTWRSGVGGNGVVPSAVVSVTRESGVKPLARSITGSPCLPASPGPIRAVT
jgi:hypothetical protein